MAKKNKPPKGYVEVTCEWLDRTLVQGQRFCLVTSQNMYDLVTKGAGWNYAGVFIDKESDARCVCHCNEDGARFTIVCIDRERMRSTARPGIEVACLLVHEAVHVFQAHCAAIGEDSPSAEYQAYAIQNIATELMVEYAKQYAQAYPDD